MSVASSKQAFVLIRLFEGLFRNLRHLAGLILTEVEGRVKKDLKVLGLAQSLDLVPSKDFRAFGVGSHV